MSGSRPRGGDSSDSGKEFLRELWRQARGGASSEKQIFDAVKARSQGKTRDELARLFESEMKRCGVPPDPIWVEYQLDLLESSPRERAQQALRHLRDLPAALSGMSSKEGLLEGLIEGEDEPSRIPGWMRPPPDATYHAISRQAEKTAVTLDSSAAAFLDRVLESIPDRLGPMGFVDVWFDTDPSVESDARVVVMIGEQRVGVLSTDASERFMPIIEAAAARDMKPNTNAILRKASRRQPPYLLVVEVPPPEGP